MNQTLNPNFKGGKTIRKIIFWGLVVFDPLLAFAVLYVSGASFEKIELEGKVLVFLLFLGPIAGVYLNFVLKRAESKRQGEHLNFTDKEIIFYYDNRPSQKYFVSNIMNYQVESDENGKYGIKINFNNGQKLYFPGYDLITVENILKSLNIIKK